MEKTFKMQPGDFMKNAGLVGLYKILEYADVTVGDDYEIPIEVLLNLDIAQCYIKVFNKKFGKETTIHKAYENLDWCIEYLKNDNDTSLKQFKDNFNDISKRFTLETMQLGIENIKDKIVYDDVYTELCDKKIKPKMNKSELLEKLMKLRKFLEQDLVEETFMFKSVANLIIRNFWHKKSFMDYNNHKRDYEKDLFRKDFEIPFKKYLEKGTAKINKYCIECGAPIFNSSDKKNIDNNAMGITFLKDMADNLDDKPSAFWNFKPDAYVCPICTMLYIMAPLGFKKLGNNFVFINNNKDMRALISANAVDKDFANEDDPKRGITYHQYINNSVMEMIDANRKQINNIQVITRISDKDRYMFFVIDKYIMELLSDKTVKYQLEKLCEKSSFKTDSGEYFNVYNECLSNLMNYRNQYNLINYLVKEAMGQDNVKYSARRVLEIQAAIKKGEGIMVNTTGAAAAGNDMRRALIESKSGSSFGAVSDETKEDIVRGMVYQLTNALNVHNRERFMDITVRLYTSFKKPIPNVFLYALKDENDDAFMITGYAFILGLKGAYKNGTNDKNMAESVNKDSDKKEFNEDE